MILAVGTRMAMPALLGGQQVVQIDIDEQEIGRNYANTAGMVGDACATLEALYRQLQGRMAPRASRRAELEALYAQRFDGSEEPEPLKSFMRAIRSATPDDGIIVQDFTQLGYYSRAHCPIYAPRSYITPSYFGTLGYGYPTALGAKVGQPERAVVLISGDGGFLYNSQELATAVRYGITPWRWCSTTTPTATCAAISAAVRGPGVRLGAVQPRLHEAGGSVRRARHAGVRPGGAGGGPAARRRQPGPHPDRGARRRAAHPVLTMPVGAAGSVLLIEVDLVIRWRSGQARLQICRRLKPQSI